MSISDVRGVPRGAVRMRCAAPSMTNELRERGSGEERCVGQVRVLATVV